MVQRSFQLASSLCHMPDLAEMGGYKHTFKLGPCHQVPGKQWCKCWAKIPQEEGRKLLTQILRPGLQKMSHNKNNNQVIRRLRCVSALNDLHALSHLTQNNCVGGDMNFLILQMASLRLREAHWLDHSPATSKRLRNPPAEGFPGPTGKWRVWASTKLRPRRGGWGEGLVARGKSWIETRLA